MHSAGQQQSEVPGDYFGVKKRENDQKQQQEEGDGQDDVDEEWKMR